MGAIYHVPSANEAGPADAGGGPCKAPPNVPISSPSFHQLPKVPASQTGLLWVLSPRGLSGVGVQEAGQDSAANQLCKGGGRAEGRQGTSNLEGQERADLQGPQRTRAGSAGAVSSQSVARAGV